ncbi:ATP-grasp domain-containing protein [Maricaulis sp. CAU 1757]
MSKPTIIITYARSLMALTVAQSVRPVGGTIVGVDSVDWTALGFSKVCDETVCVPDWREEPDAYVDALVELAGQYSADGPVLLMPIFEDTPLLARNRDRFPEGVILAAPPIEAIDKVDPKDRLAANVSSWGVAAPVTDVVKAPCKVDIARLQNDLPVVIKPAAGCGGRGVAFVEDADDFKWTLLEREGTMLIQHPAPGQDYCVAAMTDGEDAFAFSAYRNLEQFPPKRGAGALRETVDASPFVEAMRKIARHTGWRGPMQADFRWTGEPGDEPQLIEINARLWAGISHSVNAGVNYPLLMAKQALGEPLPEIGEAKIGYRSKLPFLWFASMTQASLSEAEYLEQLDESWHALTESDTGFLRKISDLWRDMTDFATLKDDIADAVERAKRGRSADVDVTSGEAKSAALGSLFIVSHLIRYGELPAEVKNDG